MKLGSNHRRHFRIFGMALMTATAIALAAPAAAQQQWKDAAAKQKWDATLSAAKKEGKLIVSGPSGKLWQTLLETFQKDYPDIKIQVTSFAGRDFWPRVIKEREVGRHLWDLRVGGTETQIYKLISEGALADVRPMLLLPEVADENNWYGGFKGVFLDNGKKYVPSFCAYDSPFVNYNTDVIKPGELKEFTDILDPKWRGKLVMADPRGGSTIIQMSAILKTYGPDFVRRMVVDQKPVITQNTRQLVTWFAQGQYPIGIGIPNAEVVRLQESGVKVNLAALTGLKTWSVGVCGLQVMEQRPNPNATVVFVNWILTKDVQENIMKAVQLNSRRKGVPFGDPERALDMDNIEQYTGTQTEEFVETMEQAKELIKNLLP